MIKARRPFQGWESKREVREIKEVKEGIEAKRGAVKAFMRPFRAL